MAAPNNTVWGSISNNYVRLGLYATTTNSNTQTKITVEVWIWSKWSLYDAANTLYFNDLSTTGSATTSYGSKTVNTTVNSGEWSTSNQQKIGTYSKIYDRTTSDVTRYLYAKLANIYNHSSEVTISADTTAKIPKLASYSVTYNANGGSGAPANQTKWYGETLPLRTGVPTRTGYTFKGWATSANGSVVYSAGDDYTANAGATLYAVWQAKTYTITYDPNGGTLGSVKTQTKTYGKALKLTGTATQANYNFLGWSTSKTATTATYKTGDTVAADELNAATTLYAVWELAYTKPRINNLSIKRCDSSGVPSDEGTNLRIIFDFETDEELDLVYAHCKKSIDDTWSGHALNVTGNKVDAIIGDNNISLDYAYVVRIEVKDIAGETAILKVIEQKSAIPFKIHPPKSADGAEIVETLFPLKITGGFECNKLETSGGTGVNIDDIITPGFYVSVNNATATYSNLPSDLSGTFSLEVLSAGAEGQIMQRLTQTLWDNPRIWVRHLYNASGVKTWGDWVLVYSADQGKVYTDSGDVKITSAGVDITATVGGRITLPAGTYVVTAILTFATGTTSSTRNNQAAIVKGIQDESGKISSWQYLARQRIFASGANYAQMCITYIHTATETTVLGAAKTSSITENSAGSTTITAVRIA